MLDNTLSALATSQQQNLAIREKLEISCEDLTDCVSQQRTHPAKKYY